MHRETETLLSAQFQILAIPYLDHLSLFLLLIPALTLHLNSNTMWDVVHAFRLSRALQLQVLLYNILLYRRARKVQIKF